ncbi:hypothetical protein [Phenylobacterium sp.]|uniref:hypothetical protein n=1 Tax=Phenylobacterium sp. TaxID=1871053 RepID=UPI0035B47C96
MPPPQPPPSTGHQPTPAQKRLALGYLLSGLGWPVVLAFLYVVTPNREHPSFWTTMQHTPVSVAVVWGGGAFGALLALVGAWIVRRERRRPGRA